MAKDWQIRNRDGTQSTASGQVLEVKNGKRKHLLLGVTHELSKYDVKTYRIDHIPSGSYVCSGYYYLSTARAIAREIIVRLGQALITDSIQSLQGMFSPPFKMYINFFAFKDCKHPMPFEEWVNGPDYEGLASNKDNSIVSNNQESIDEKWLHDGHSTIAWLGSQRGTMDGYDLRCLIENRRTPSEEISPLEWAKGHLSQHAR